MSSRLQGKSLGPPSYHYSKYLIRDPSWRHVINNGRKISQPPRTKPTFHSASSSTSTRTRGSLFSTLPSISQAVQHMQIGGGVFSLGDGKHHCCHDQSVAGWVRTTERIEALFPTSDANNPSSSPFSSSVDGKWVNEAKKSDKKTRSLPCV